MTSVAFGLKGPGKAHLLRGQGGLGAEIADLRADAEDAFTALEAKTGYPAVTKITGGGAVSIAALPVTSGVVGSGFLQGQTKATLTLGTGTASLAFTASRPGTPGNALSVAIVQGVATLSVAATSSKVTITLAAAGSTAAAVKAALDASATANLLVQCVAGGTGTVLVHAETALAGGLGLGFSASINGVEQAVVGAVTDTVLPLVVTTLTGYANLDLAVLDLVSNGVKTSAPLRIVT